MALYEQFAHACVRLTAARAPDREGGQNIVWREGPAFTAYIAPDTSLESRRAEQEGVKSQYTVLVGQAVPLACGDHFRAGDGTVYRVTSRPEEKQAPAMASFRLKAFTAERTVLPT